MIWKRTLWLAAALLASLARAGDPPGRRTVVLVPSVQAVPSLVTGTLSPLSIRVDGQEVLKSDDNATTLQLNGVAVFPQYAPSKPFFTRVSGDRFVVRYRLETSSEWQESALELPAATILQVSARAIELQISPGVGRAFVDQKAIALRGERAIWKLSADPGWLAQNHVLELESASGGPGRLYNVRLTPEDSGKSRRVTLADFELFLVDVLQSQGGEAFAPGVGWAPAIAFRARFGIRPAAALIPMQKADGSIFPALRLELRPYLKLGERWEISATGGLEVWLGYGGARPAIGALAAYRFHLRWLDRVLAGYSRLLDPDNPAHQLRAGVGITF